MKKRDKAEMMKIIRAQADADGTPLSNETCILLDVVLDMLDRAYSAGYEKGYKDGQAVDK